MTHEELAKHWGVSLKEVKRISDYMNHNYYFALAQNKETKLWHGVIYKFHESPSGNRTPHLWTSSAKGFETEREAAKNWNELADTMIRKANPILEGIPVDAYKAIKKLELSPIASHKAHKHTTSPVRGSRE